MPQQRNHGLSVPNRSLSLVIRSSKPQSRPSQAPLALGPPSLKPPTDAASFAPGAHPMQVSSESLRLRSS
ncbi:hypothetical protein Nepgr_015989 [Nepenthes gracilis]|uniref:Uncharacterized protein n=1 Tax=Nepenthes gracilis TaxID=150966 RepID=A0AAD3SLX5_NEPGR|nr:hypothetical protein Nepgr_015989 [Nepenthes gracilis]